MIEYLLQLADPGGHELALRMTFSTEPGEHVRLTLPAWIPGSYMIRDFARNLMDERAYDSLGQSFALQKLDKQTWQLTAPGNRVTVEYRVYAFDESVRSAYFDNTRAFFNGTSLFLRLVGREHDEHRLTIEKPGHLPMQQWGVSTTLPGLLCDDRGFGSYRADDYEQLVDHPVEIGIHDQIAFTAMGRSHRMVLVDAPGVDAGHLAKDLAPICGQHAAMFGELPVEQYLFLTLATADGYGGLEHRDSTMLVCKRSDLPYPGTAGISKGYRTFLALCSHEYFHLWNVKRIRPQRLAEADLQAEVHTELLWAFEGITSYYDELALPRAGVIDAKTYLDMLAPSLSRYYRNHGRHRQSVAESSFDAWTRFYKQDENAPNAIVSYYNKGGLVAFGLDHLLRTRSNDALSLDDVMRQLWQRYGKSGKGVPERHMEREIAELLGQSVDDFFADYIYGTVELPLQGWFADFGIGLRLRAGANADDTGGAVDPEAAAPPAAMNLGARVAAADGAVRIEQTLQGGPAREAGLSSGDLLLALDGERCTVANLAELLARRVPGDAVELVYFRRNRLQSTVVKLQAPLADTCDLWLLPEAELDPRVVNRRRSWLAPLAWEP